MTWLKVAHKSDISEKKGKEITIKGTRIALFHANDKFYEKFEHRWRFTLSSSDGKREKMST